MTLEQLAILNEQAEKIRKLTRLYNYWTSNGSNGADADFFQMREENWKRIPDAIKGKFISDAADWMLKEIAQEEAVFASISVKAES